MNMVETLNRTMKLAMDEGRVGSIQEAQTLFHSFCLRLLVSPGFSASPAAEAAVLTLLNAAPKTFLGGVRLEGPLDERCTKAWFAGQTLGEVAERFGVSTAPSRSDGMPTICVGDGTSEERGFWLGVSLQTEGFVLSPDGAQSSSQRSSVDTGVAAAGASLCEAFRFVYQKSPLAGQREICWTLPGSRNLVPIDSLWLIGLGHLGQAFLWTAALAGGEYLPRLVKLTDYDAVSWSSLSTCLLVDPKDVGRHKVDVIAERLKTLGVLVQRDHGRLNLDLGPVQSAAEQVVVAVDNIALRRSLDRIIAGRVLEAGIGNGADAFTRIQLHAFPGPRKARDVWVGEDDRSARAADLSGPVYQALLKETGDQCGTALVAGISVATPFVGAVAGAMLARLATKGTSSDFAWNVDVASL